MTFNIFTELCDHGHDPILEHFHQLTKRPFMPIGHSHSHPVQPPHGISDTLSDGLGRLQLSGTRTAMSFWGTLTAQWVSEEGTSFQGWPEEMALSWAIQNSKHFPSPLTLHWYLRFPFLSCVQIRKRARVLGLHKSLEKLGDSTCISSITSQPLSMSASLPTKRQ